MPTTFPANGATVWVRATFLFSPPFQATWATATALFTDVTSGYTVPWYEVNAWRAV